MKDRLVQYQDIFVFDEIKKWFLILEVNDKENIIILMTGNSRAFGYISVWKIPDKKWLLRNHWNDSGYRLI